MKPLLYATALLAAPAALAQDSEIDTATGPATVAAAAETVAVFDIAVIDTLDALGISPDACRT